jgi:hypothetical protein
MGETRRRFLGANKPVPLLGKVKKCQITLPMAWDVMRERHQSLQSISRTTISIALQ